MKVLLQWTTRNPSDWVEIDSASWVGLPKRPEPVGGEEIDNTFGWVFGLNIQGVEFAADHYAVEDLPDGTTKVTIWNDDSVDHPDGEKYAREWVFSTCRPSKKCGGAYNTAQLQTFYGQSVVMSRTTQPAQTTGGPVQSD